MTDDEFIKMSQEERNNWLIERKNRIDQMRKVLIISGLWIAINFAMLIGSVVALLTFNWTVAGILLVLSLISIFFTGKYQKANNHLFTHDK